MKVLRWLDKNAELVIMCVLLAAMTGVMFVNVIARYIFSNSLTWSDEFCRYCFCLAVFFGCAFCNRFGLNLRVDSIVKMLPAKLRFVIELVVNLITMGLFGGLCIASWGLVETAHIMGSTSPAMEIPQWILYGFMMLGFGLATVRSLQVLIIHSLVGRKGGETDK